MTDYALIANDGKQLTVFVNETVTAYKHLANNLHVAACMAMFHALQYRECSALNSLFEGMRVNDQTALKIWVAKNTLTPGACERNPDENPKTLIGWKKDKGFFVRKGMVSLDAWALEALFETDPFFNRNVADKKAFGLAELLAMAEGFKKQAEKRADDNDVIIPSTVMEALASLAKAASAEKAKVANDNPVAAAETRSNVA